MIVDQSSIMFVTLTFAATKFSLYLTLVYSDDL